MKRLILRMALAALAALCLLSVPAESQWVQTEGPYGGDFYSLTANGNDLYACTNGGIMHSSDRGKNWRKLAAPKALFPEIQVVGAKLFAGTYSGVFLSLDGGTTWSAVNTGLTNLRIYTLLVDGTDLFAATGAGVFMSSNDGTTWTALSQGPTGSVNGLIKHGNKIIAGSNGDGIYVSSDKGATWSPIQQSLNTTTIRSLAALGNSIFVALDDGVFLSMDDGNNWSSVHTGLPEPQAYDESLLIPSGSDLFYGTSDGVYRSTNNGSSWTNSRGFNSYVAAIATDGDALYLCGDAGIFRSADKATSWNRVDTGVIGTTSRAIAGSIDDAGTTHLYAAGAYIYHSSDLGSTWHRLDSGTRLGTSIALLGKEVFVGSDTGLFRLSADRSRWIPAGIGGEYVRNVYSTGTTLLAATQPLDFASYGAYVSTDGGATWTVCAGFPNGALNFTSIGSDLFAGTYNSGVFYSSDNGFNWTKCTNIPAGSIYGIGSNDDYLFVSNGWTQGSIYRSSDKGVTWGACAFLGGGVVYGIKSIGGLVFAAGDFGLFVSTNNGTTWLDAGSKPDHFYTAQSITFVGDKLFAAAAGAGIWYRKLSDYAQLGVSDHLKQNGNITLSPNPTTSVVKVQMRSRKGATEETRVVISSLIGQQLLDIQNTIGDQFSIDLTALPSGAYLARFISEGSSVTKLIIKD